jgi:hypothetical protein
MILFQKMRMPHACLPHGGGPLWSSLTIDESVSTWNALVCNCLPITLDFKIHQADLLEGF